MTTKTGWVMVGLALIMAATAVAGEDTRSNRGLHARVRVQTSLGPMVIEVDGEKAPLAASNFVQYVEDGYYDGTVFHRVLKGGLIQGGAFTKEMDRKTAGLRDPIKYEPDTGLKNVRGSVAIYRVAGTLDSAKAEFFINVGDNPVLDRRHLDGGAYTVFGKVVKGMETVDRIASTAVSTHPKYARGRSKVVPVKPVIIESAKVLSSFDYAAARAFAEKAARERQLAASSAGGLRAREVAARIAEIETKYAKTMTTTPSGLKYLTIRPGTGAPPIESETVSVHYVGTLANGVEFENTYTHLNSLPVTKIVSKFISGLREGILGMREGAKRVFVVPPELAFKDLGIPGKIPPDSTLFFELELLAIEDAE